MVPFQPFAHWLRRRKGTTQARGISLVRCPPKFLYPWPRRRALESVPIEVSWSMAPEAGTETSARRCFSARGVGGGHWSQCPSKFLCPRWCVTGTTISFTLQTKEDVLISRACAFAQCITVLAVAVSSFSHFAACMVTPQERLALVQQCIFVMKASVDAQIELGKQRKRYYTSPTFQKALRMHAALSELMKYCTVDPACDTVDKKLETVKMAIDNSSRWRKLVGQSFARVKVNQTAAAALQRRMHALFLFDSMLANL
jgi:hypothetical protein